MHKNLKHIWSLLKLAFIESRKDGVANLSASLAYYLIFSLAPLFYVIITFGGLFYKKEVIAGEIFYYLERAIGEGGANFFQTILHETSTSTAEFWPAVIGIFLLLFGAINFYVSLERAAEKIYSKGNEEGISIRAFIKKRIFSIFFLVGASIVLVSMVFLNFAISLVRTFVATDMFIETSPIFKLWEIQLFNMVVAYFAIFFIFSVIYKALSNFKLAWKDIFVGASVSAFFFMVANFGLSQYFKYTAIASFYGVGGSIVLTLIWIYYSSQIFLFGGEVIKVHERLRIKGN